MKKENVQIQVIFAQTSLKLLIISILLFLGLFIVYLMIYSIYYSLGEQVIHTL